MTPDHLFLTADEYAELMRVTPTKVRRLVRSGQLGSIKIGKQYRIPYPEAPTAVALQIAKSNRTKGASYTPADLVGGFDQGSNRADSA
jgi:excisionase family DNA binding protein